MLDLIVVGASAGGVEALTYLVNHLPPDLNAAVIVVLHIPANSPSVLADILGRQGNLPASQAKDGEAIISGHIYVAPPDHHVIVKPGYLHLTRGPRENSHRPAIDPLFRTAARAYGQRVIAVLLTGMLDDGTAGVMAVKMRRGVAIVQDPDDAMFSEMPLSALENVEDIDYVLPLSEIPSILVALANIPMQAKPEIPVSKQMELESDMVQLDMKPIEDNSLLGNPSTFVCPECGGTLWEIQEGNLLRFRCHTGHGFSMKTLLEKQSEAVEDALWIAMRALQEKATLAQRTAAKMRDRNLPLAAQTMEQQADDAQQQSAIIQELLKMGDAITQKDITSH